MTGDPQDINCSKLHGVGPKMLARLHKLKLMTVQDLLLHVPTRYEDRTKISPISHLTEGARAAVVGTLLDSKIIPKRRAVLYCTVQDSSGTLCLCFFNFTKQKLQFKFKPGVRVYCYGEVRWVDKSLVMIHPEYKILAQDEAVPLTPTLTPVYSTTDGLSQLALRKLMAQALDLAKNNKQFLEHLPAALLQQLDLPPMVEALCLIHQPPASLARQLLAAPQHPMQVRLIFEELLAWQLGLFKLRAAASSHAAAAVTWSDAVTTQFLAALPFTLTTAQLRVLAEIAHDLQQPRPMLRLLQGDVGCGKTIVAALAIAQVVHSGYQAALMAPTELLAAQHGSNMQRWLEPFGIKLVFLSSNVTGPTRLKRVLEIAKGEAQVVVGTHSLFQEKIIFKRLALVVIDEQQRFGVHQRAQLCAKGNQHHCYPHQLIMSATPIPRTLALALYADLDHSIIDELPHNREPVTTILLANRRRHELIAHVSANCHQGKQVYWVCPLITESEFLQCQAAESMAESLAALLPALRIGLVHGKKTPEQKEKIMQEFRQHQLDILVATTVIEVGVDVPNASIMIIENAERLGLVQLHQLRGRVGRGQVAGFCVLLYQAPLSSLARQRLLLLRHTLDGFRLAQKDLEIRGSGELFGTKQTGLPQLRVADLARDQDLMPKVQEVATLLWQQQPQTAKAIAARWLGAQEKYGHIV